MKQFIVVILVFVVNSFVSQLDSVHWIPPLHSATRTTQVNQYLYLSTPSQSNLTVNIMDGARNILASPIITRGAPFRYFIGDTLASQLFVDTLMLNTVQTDKGFILESSGKFYANVRIEQPSQGEMLTAKGRAGAGTSFRIGVMPHVEGNGVRNSMCSIMGTEDNTLVSVNDYDVNINFFTGPNSAPLSQSSLSFVLNEGETYTFALDLRDSLNFTGLIGGLITADKPVVVNSGNYLGTLTDTTGQGQDIALDQLVSTDVIGQEYVSIRGRGNQEMEAVLVIAHENNTDVYVNGSSTPIANLNAGDWYLIRDDNYVGIGHKNMYINSTKAIYCFQYIGGSISSATPGMNILAPITCDLSSNIDAIPAIDSIGDVALTGGIFVVARANAFVNINNVQQTNPEPIQGLSSWVTYRLTGVTGDQVVDSDGNIIVGMFGVNAALGATGYYSGFDRLPQEVVTNPLTSNLDSCGNILLTVSPAYQSYTWYRNDSLLPLSGDSNIVSQSGDYYVVLTNDFGCNDSAFNDNVVVFSPPIAIASVDTVLNCREPIKVLDGNNSQGNNLVYSWSTNFGSILDGSNTSNPSVDSAGVYVLEIQDVLTRCYSYDSVLITMDTIKPYVYAGVDTLINCFNPQINLQAIDSLLTKAYYNWSTIDGNILGSNMTKLVNISLNGTYFITLTDSINGCMSTDTVFVGIDTISPIVAVSTDTLINCYNPIISLSGIGSSTGSYEYDWSTQNGEIISGRQTLAPEISDSGVYVLDVTNTLNGCVSTDSLSVQADFNSNSSILFDNQDIGQIEITTFIDYSFSYIGDSGYFEWLINDNQILDSAFFYSFDESGEFDIILNLQNNENGCWASDTLKVLVVHDLMIPSVVSANEDGFNDFFEIKALENYDDSHIVIFNRWGSKVFEESPYLNKWRGENNLGNNLFGDIVPDGTYFYIIKLSSGQEVKNYQGYIELKK